MSVNNSTVYTTVYCTEEWRIFWNYFRIGYIPAKIVLCSLGMVTNILNIVVFTRPKMRNPTNIILASLALIDILCVGRELEYVSLYYCNRRYGRGRSTYGIGVAELINEILLMLFNTWSIYLTLLISIWRLIGVIQPLQSRTWCTSKGAKKAITMTLLWILVLMIPMYYNIRIVPSTNTQKETEYQWTLDSEIAWKFYLWTHAILIKLGPCVLLTVVMLCLVISLIKAKVNRRKLCKSSTICPNPNQSVSESESQSLEFDRTTRMLLMILLLFLVTQLPFGVVNIVTIFMGPDFSNQCKEPLLAFFNIGEYVNASTTFFVYFVMSANFRHTFCTMWKGLSLCSCVRERKLFRLSRNNVSGQVAGLSEPTSPTTSTDTINYSQSTQSLPSSNP